MKRYLFFAIVLLAAVGLLISSCEKATETSASSAPPSAAPDLNKGGGVRVQGTEFDPQHLCDAKAAWVRGIGLPAADDPFAAGFLMKKLCATGTNAASFGTITGVTGETLVGPDALGFDYKNVNDGFTAHCGAGAPRFNVTMSDGFHFLGGCANGTQTPGPASGWTRVRINPQADNTQAFPGVSTFATIVSISLVFDEGPDACCGGSPQIVLDNIFINGRFVTH